MHDLLIRTSRTSALAIPLLPEPARQAVSAAYLLLRVAHALEDAPAWPRDARRRALTELGELLRAPDLARAGAAQRGWLTRRPTTDPAGLELMAAVPRVLAEAMRLAPGARAPILRHALRAVQGMHARLGQADEQGRVRLADLEQLRRHCRAVAGPAGEMLTDVLVHHAPGLARVEPALVEHQVAFGEGLQLVSILADEERDAAEGRAYRPERVPRAALAALARADLLAARRYVEALVQGGAPPGFVAFTTLPVELAEATLDVLERDGAGAALGHDEALRLAARVRAAAEEPPPAPLLATPEPDGAAPAAGAAPAPDQPPQA